MKESPHTLAAGLGLILIVGLVSVLGSSITGQSFGVSQYSAPQPDQGIDAYRGFGYGPYQQPFSRDGFYEAQRLCSPASNKAYSFPPNQHDCCLRMCEDVCKSYDPRPAPCQGTCTRGCMEQQSY